MKKNTIKQTAMFRIGQWFLCIVAIVMGYMPTDAQTDSRNRTANTIIADGLAQLPAKDTGTLAQVIGEMANTGAEGIRKLADMMEPSWTGQNKAVEYAIDGIVNYITQPQQTALRKQIHDELAAQTAACKDTGNKAFLIVQLGKIAEPGDTDVFMECMDNQELKPYALGALSNIKGIDEDRLLNHPDMKIADIAYLAQTGLLSAEKAEDRLLSLTATLDKNTLVALYKALAACGSMKSLNVLANAPRQIGAAREDTGAEDAYLKLLDRLADKNAYEVYKAGKSLSANKQIHIRCAALNLILKTAGAKRDTEFIKALKDNNAQYRNTALLYASDCGDVSMANVVAKALPQLKDDAATDAIRWLGNCHAEAQSKAVVKAMDNKNSTLALAAIEAAGKTGGPHCLDALIEQLDGQHADAARNALLCFNGDVKFAIAQTLDNKNGQVVINALDIARQRKIHSTYNKVLELTADKNPEVAKAAYEALGGVATAENIKELCKLMEKTQGDQTAHLQQAIMNAMKPLDADKQFDMAVQTMNTSARRALYYPILAQAGNGNAIRTLQEENNKEANEALLRVDNTDMLPILLDMAKDQDETGKDRILNRYLTLANRAPVNATERYILLRSGNELEPSTPLRNKYITALGRTHTLQALAYMRKFYDEPDNADATAEAVKEIVGHNEDLNGGKAVKELLETAKNRYAHQYENADAGYAIDELNGMMHKTAAEGYSMNRDRTKMGVKGYWSLNGNFENFNMSFDWNAEGEMGVNLRSMTVFTLDRNKGLRMTGSEEWIPFRSMGPWNTVNIKVVDDRVNISVNGNELVTNAVMNCPDGSTFKTTGNIGFQADMQGAIVTNTCFRHLPKTPVSVLSEEEENEGFELLFDGRSLEKWQGNTTNYVPSEGNIYVSAAYGSGGNLYTKKKYSDFVYRFEFCFVTPGVNNGIGIRTNIGSDAAYDGMEIQVLDHDDPIYKGLQPYQQHGSVYGIIVPKHVKFGPLGTWNTEEIRAVGDHITVTVNGEVILDGNIREACKGHNVAPDGANSNPYTVDHRNHPGLFNKEGYISFCGHGEGVKFRNVRILDLSRQKDAKPAKTSKKKKR